MESLELGELIPGLPDELGLECMTRLPYTAHRVASRVCRRWRDLLQSRDFYNHRRVNGRTLKVACFVQTLPNQNYADASESESKSKSKTPRYGITVLDPVGRTWARVDPPVSMYPEGMPMFCQVAGCDGKLVVMGGWDPVSYEPVRDVSVWDLVSGRWKKGKEMPEKRSFFAIGSSGKSGRVYVSGGHDEGKNAMGTAWVYDLRNDDWVELPPMSSSGGRDECEGFVVAGEEGNEEFWVVGGYGTEDQGGFKGDAEVYEVGSGSWRRVEGAWVAGRCPRGRVGWSGGKGKIVDWGDMDMDMVGGNWVGVCGVEVGLGVGVVVVVTVRGSEYYYLREEGGDDDNVELLLKWERIDGVPQGFTGFVQSGCSLEI